MTENVETLAQRTRRIALEARARIDEQQLEHERQQARLHFERESTRLYELCRQRIDETAAGGLFSATVDWTHAGEYMTHVEAVTEDIVRRLQADGFEAAWEGDFDDDYGAFKISW